MRCEQQDKLALEQLRLALRSLKPNCWLMPIFAAILCMMFANWISPGVLIFWFLLVAVGGAYLGVVAYAFLRKQPPPSEQKEMRDQPCHGSVFLFAASWSSMGILVVAAGQRTLNRHMVIILVHRLHARRKRGAGGRQQNTDRARLRRTWPDAGLRASAGRRCGL